MKFFITEQAKKEAREYSDKIIKNLEGKPNYTNISTDDRYYFGYLGEWVFCKFLVRNDIQFKWGSIAIQDKVDNGDFIIKNKIIDVKTASKPEYKNIMMPEKQLYRKSDFYVGIRLDGDSGEIMGFCTHQDIQEVETKDFGKGPTKAIKFEELRNIDYLINKLKC